ncbi:MAG: hypothetical protein RIC89_18960 [Pseudomonadales bacterium]
MQHPPYSTAREETSPPDGFHGNGFTGQAAGERLLDLGRECAQGYGIAPPMSAEQLVPWLNSWAAPAPWLIATSSKQPLTACLSRGADVCGRCGCCSMSPR